MSDPWTILRLHLTLPLSVEPLLAGLFPDAADAPLRKRYDLYSAGVLGLIKSEAKRLGVKMPKVNLPRESLE